MTPVYCRRAERPGLAVALIVLISVQSYIGVVEASSAAVRSRAMVRGLQLLQEGSMTSKMINMNCAIELTKLFNENGEYIAKDECMLACPLEWVQAKERAADLMDVLSGANPESCERFGEPQEMELTDDQRSSFMNSAKSGIENISHVFSLKSGSMGEGVVRRILTMAIERNGSTEDFIDAFNSMLTCQNMFGAKCDVCRSDIEEHEDLIEKQSELLDELVNPWLKRQKKLLGENDQEPTDEERSMLGLPLSGDAASSDAEVDDQSAIEPHGDDIGARSVIDGADVDLSETDRTVRTSHAMRSKIRSRNSGGSMSSIGGGGGGDVDIFFVMGVVLCVPLVILVFVGHALKWTFRTIFEVAGMIVRFFARIDFRKIPMNVNNGWNKFKSGVSRLASSVRDRLTPSSRLPGPSPTPDLPDPAPTPDLPDPAPPRNTCTMSCVHGYLDRERCRCHCNDYAEGSKCDRCTLTPLQCKNGGVVDHKACTCKNCGLWSGRFCEQCILEECPYPYVVDTENCRCVERICDLQDSDCNGGFVDKDTCACKCNGEWDKFENRCRCDLDCKDELMLDKVKCMCVDPPKRRIT